MILLKWILLKRGVRISTGFIWLRIWTTEHVDSVSLLSIYIEGMKFLGCMKPCRLCSLELVILGPSNC